MTDNPHVVELVQLDHVQAGDVAIIRAEVGSDVAPQLIAGTVRAITPWSPTSTWHLIEYTSPVLDGVYRFPVSPASVYTFVRAFRTNSEEEPTMRQCKPDEHMWVGGPPDSQGRPTVVCGVCNAK